jgi:hypothetical protein
VQAVAAAIRVTGGSGHATSNLRGSVSVADKLAEPVTLSQESARVSLASEADPPGLSRSSGSVTTSDKRSEGVTIRRNA